MKTFFVIILMAGMLFSSSQYFGYNSMKQSTDIDSTSLKNLEVELQDGEVFEVSLEQLFEPIGKTPSSTIGFDSRDFAEKPFLIRSYERHDSEFELLTNYTLDNFIWQYFDPRDVISGENNYLFWNYKRIHETSFKSPFTNEGITNYEFWRQKLGSDPDNFWWFNIERYGKKEEDINLFVKTFGGGHADYVGQQSWPLEFFHSLIKEKVARELMYNYVLSSYNNVELKIPHSSKQEILSILNKLVIFLDQKISTIKIDNKNPDWPEIIVPNGKMLGYFESFLVRRLYIDKIPLIELKTYLKGIEQAVQKSLNKGAVPYVFKVKINKDIIITDENPWQINVTSKLSGKEIKIKCPQKNATIKCLVDKGQNFYQFERRTDDKVEFLGLYNAQLDVIRSPK